MKAIIQSGYGRPSRTLKVCEVGEPDVSEDSVLVRVACASLNAKDWHIVTGRPIVARAVLGILRPKNVILGSDLAGVVEAVGPAVTAFQPGDQVFGTCDGSFAELAAVRPTALAHKPAPLSFAQAATLPVAGVTALMAVRDRGALQPGESVLVLGAGGGVGTFAVQIARADGGRVTAETRSSSVEVVRALGPDRVIDRATEDVLRGDERFDLVIDAGGFATSGQLSRLLTQAGRAVIVGAGDGTSAGMALGMIGSRARSRLGGRPIGTFLAQISRERLEALGELIDAGSLAPVIDTAVPLDDVPAALEAMLDGKARGKTVVNVAA